MFSAVNIYRYHDNNIFFHIFSTTPPIRPLLSRHITYDKKK